MPAPSHLHLAADRNPEPLKARSQAQVIKGNKSQKLLRPSTTGHLKISSYINRLGYLTNYLAAHLEENKTRDTTLLCTKVNSPWVKDPNEKKHKNIRSKNKCVFFFFLKHPWNMVDRFTQEKIPRSHKKKIRFNFVKNLKLCGQKQHRWGVWGGL